RPRSRSGAYRARTAARASAVAGTPRWINDLAGGDLAALLRPALPGQRLPAGLGVGLLVQVVRWPVADQVPGLGLQDAQGTTQGAGRVRQSLRPEQEHQHDDQDDEGGGSHQVAAHVGSSGTPPVTGSSYVA